MRFRPVNNADKTETWKTTRDVALYYATPEFLTSVLPSNFELTTTIAIATTTTTTTTTCRAFSLLGFDRLSRSFTGVAKVFLTRDLSFRIRLMTHNRIRNSDDFRVRQ